MSSGQFIARGLLDLASDYACYNRIPMGVQWYQPDPETGLRLTPVLPHAMHDALCASSEVALADVGRGLVVCASCSLAVENGPDS